MRRLRRGRCVRDLGFLELPIARISEQVVGVARAHDAGAGQRECYARGVDGDPAATPLLGNGGGGARTASRIEHEIAGIGSHQYTSLDHCWRRLDHIDLVGHKAGRNVLPAVVELYRWEVLKVSDVAETLHRRLKAPSSLQPCHALLVCFPSNRQRRFMDDAVYVDTEPRGCAFALIASSALRREVIQRVHPKFTSPRSTVLQ